MTLRYTKPPTQRQLRVGELIRTEISVVFSRGVIPVALENMFITVTEVRVSPDLKMATAFLTAFDGDRDKLEPMLKSLGIEIRRIITPKLNLRFSPEIRLVFDDSTDYATRIENLLNKV